MNFSSAENRKTSNQSSTIEKGAVHFGHEFVRVGFANKSQLGN